MSFVSKPVIKRRLLLSLQSRTWYLIKVFRHACIRFVVFKSRLLSLQAPSRIETSSAFSDPSGKPANTTRKAFSRVRFIAAAAWTMPPPVQPQCQAQVDPPYGGCFFWGPAHSCFASQVVFEALHIWSHEAGCRGLDHCHQLLVGILIFLLLAVLLWKVSGDRGSPGSLHPDSPALLPCWDRAP